MSKDTLHNFLANIESALATVDVEGEKLSANEGVIQSYKDGVIHIKRPFQVLR